MRVKGDILFPRWEVRRELPEEAIFQLGNASDLRIISRSNVRPTGVVNRRQRSLV